MLIYHYWTRLLFGYQEIARTRRKWKLVCLPRKYKKGKKNRVDKIKKKFCLVKKIVRKVILKVDVAFSCHVSTDVANDFDK